MSKCCHTWGILGGAGPVISEYVSIVIGMATNVSNVTKQGNGKSPMVTSWQVMLFTEARAR